MYLVYHFADDEELTIEWIKYDKKVLYELNYLMQQKIENESRPTNLLDFLVNVSSAKIIFLLINLGCFCTYTVALQEAVLIRGNK